MLNSPKTPSHWWLCCLPLLSFLAILLQAGPPAEEDDSRESDAVAFKNRLVGYDRNAAQRTKVIDDQSDYFEIDSNTWLSVEVNLTSFKMLPY